MENIVNNPWSWSQVLWLVFISIVIVFLVLVLMVGVMSLFGRLFARTKVAEKTSSIGNKTVSSGLLHEEEVAAIMTALKLYKSDLHDKESEVLTILSIKRAYSPWNSKIHGLTQLPNHK